MKCLNCNFELDSTYTFCPKCGTKISMVCRNCHKKRTEEAEFCPFCGKSYVKNKNNASAQEVVRNEEHIHTSQESDNFKDDIEFNNYKPNAPSDNHNDYSQFNYCSAQSRASTTSSSKRNVIINFLLGRGRINRSSFVGLLAIIFSLFGVFVFSVLLIIEESSQHYHSSKSLILFLSIASIPCSVVILQLMWLRLHDLNKSGGYIWLMLFSAVALTLYLKFDVSEIIVWLFILYLLLAPGTLGPNRYGPQPELWFGFKKIKSIVTK